MTDQIRGGLPVSQQQADVVDHALHYPVTVVVAGAGSGKTHTIVAAILEILMRRISNIDQFVLITFTNKAAEELRNRLSTELKQLARTTRDPYWIEQLERISGAYIGTIHGFCSSLLKVFGYQDEIARESHVTMSPFYLTEALKDASEELLNQETPGLEPWRREKHKLPKLAREIIEQSNNLSIDLQALLRNTEAQPEDPGKETRVTIARLVEIGHALYEERKQQMHILDTHDLLARLDSLLRGPAGALIQRRLAERYKYVFIDEFQDTDGLQKQIFDHLLPQLSKLVVVGDRKQSIYGFRAAEPLLILQLAEENQVQPLLLSISRRPTLALLNVQNALFQNISATNPQFQELGEPLDPWEGTIEQPADLDPFTFIAVTNIDAYQAMVHQIQDVLNRNIYDANIKQERTVEPGDITILARTNRMVEDYEANLNRLLASTGVMVKRDEGGKFFQQAEIVASYQMLRLLLLYPDETALSIAFNTPYMRNVDAAQKELEILQYGRLRGNPLRDWFFYQYPELGKKIIDLRAAVRRFTVPQLLAKLYIDFGIREYYAQSGNRKAVENLEKLREKARQLFREEQALTLRQFVDWLEERYSMEISEEEGFEVIGDNQEGPNYIRIMTIHRAKGLEFPIVMIPEIQRPVGLLSFAQEFLVTRTEGLELSKPSSNQQRLRAVLAQNRMTRVLEEMRLFYVAVTRAQQAVYLYGDDNTQIIPQTNRNFAWEHAVIRARADIQAYGARFLSV